MQPPDVYQTTATDLLWYLARGYSVDYALAALGQRVGNIPRDILDAAIVLAQGGIAAADCLNRYNPPVQVRSCLGGFQTAGTITLDAVVYYHYPGEAPEAHSTLIREPDIGLRDTIELATQLVTDTAEQVIPDLDSPRSLRGPTAEAGPAVIDRVEYLPVRFPTSSVVPQL